MHRPRETLKLMKAVSIVFWLFDIGYEVYSWLFLELCTDLAELYNQ